MISGAQLFVAVWLGCALVYAVPVWATLSLSKARRACGAYTDFDHLIDWTNVYDVGKKGNGK